MNRITQLFFAALAVFSTTTSYGQHCNTAIYRNLPTSVATYSQTARYTTQLRRDTRFCQPVQPTRPSELVPIFPTNPNPAPPPSRPGPVPTSPSQPSQQPASQGCCDELLTRLNLLSAKVDNMKATAELDPASVDALANAVSAKINIGDLDTSGLATKTDLEAIRGQINDLTAYISSLQFPDVSQLATKSDIQQLEIGHAGIVSLLEQLVDLPPVPPGDGGNGNYRELAILIQRNAQSIASMSDRLDLLVRNQQATDNRVKEIALAVQDHTVQIQRLVASVDGINTTVGDTDSRMDSIENDIRNISIRLQRVEGNTSSPLTAVEKEQRIEEMIVALSEVLGGKIRLRLKFDPETGAITGAEQY